MESSSKTDDALLPSLRLKMVGFTNCKTKTLLGDLFQTGLLNKKIKLEVHQSFPLSNDYWI